MTGAVETRPVAARQPSEEELTDCLGLTPDGQVVYFDQAGRPFQVGLAGQRLEQGDRLDLPRIAIQVITPGQAARRLAWPALPGFTTEQRFLRNQPVAQPWHWMAAAGLVMLLTLAMSQTWKVGRPGSVTIIKQVAASQPLPAEMAAAFSPVAGYSPMAPPTISEAVFEAFLTELNSPARPEAGKMYRVCLEEGCDPALALAFFEHESSGGRAGIAALTRSVGNIRCSPGYDCLATSGNGSFRQYASWSEGLRDWARLLRFYKNEWRLVSLEQIIPRYAPQADNNNEAAYIATIKLRVDNLRQR